jgi:hypothetical protein
MLYVRLLVATSLKTCLPVNVFEEKGPSKLLPALMQGHADAAERKNTSNASGKLMTVTVKY